MSSSTVNILLIDDEPNFRDLTAKGLRFSCGYHVDTAADANTARSIIQQSDKNYQLTLRI